MTPQTFSCHKKIYELACAHTKTSQIKDRGTIPDEHPGPTQLETSPHQTSHHQCADPRIDSLGSPHLESKSSGPLSQGFTPKTRKRPRVDVIKSTHLKPSFHLTGTTTVPHPKPECDLRYQRIPLLDPPRATSFKKTSWRCLKIHH